MAGVSLGGMASGLDTNTMVQQLMAIEKQPLTRLDASRFRAEGRKIAMDDLAVRMRGLTTARADLAAAALWKDVQKLETSDATRVAVRTATGGVPAAGTYAVEVTKLAVAQQSTFTYSPPGGNNKTVTVAFGDGKSVTTAPNATSVADVAAAINAPTANLDVYAEVVGGELVLRGKTPGAAFSVVPNGQMTATTGAPKNVAAAPADVKVTMNGAVQTGTLSGNTWTGGGLVVEARNTTVPGTPATVTVGALGKDLDGIKTKVKAFVDAYNSLVDYARAELTEAKATNPRSALDGAKGALRGDAGLSGVLSSLRIAMGSTVDGVHPDRNTLSELGVGLFAPSASVSKSDGDRLGGKLVFDEAKLAAAMTTNPDEVRKAFDAVGAKVAGIVEPFSRSGDGVLAGRAQQADSEATRIKRQYADLEKRLEARETRLRAYFTRMETALSGAQAQTSWLQGQIAGLNG